jgi:hypothetical protein
VIPVWVDTTPNPVDTLTRVGLEILDFPPIPVANASHRCFQTGAAEFPGDLFSEPGFHELFRKRTEVDSPAYAD